MKTAPFLLLLLVCTSGFAEPTRRVDSLMSTLYKLDQFSGSILVAENGKALYSKSFGPENQSGSVYTLGSVSKTLTATAILQLKEQNLVELDAKLANYLPDFPYPGITIRHLLTHTSSLPDYNLYEAEMEQKPGKIFSNADVIPSLINWKKSLPFQPGEKWSYSNTNYCLLALVIEKVSGMSFEKYMQKNIFAAAGMMHTSFLNEKDATFTDRVTNYEYPFLFSTKLEIADSLKKNRWRSYNMSGFVGQGNVMTTTADMLAFDQALYSGKLLSASSLREAFTPATLNNGNPANTQSSIGKAFYGLGWFIMQDSAQGKIVWHSGGVPGGLSILIRNISKNQTVIAFDNHFGTNLYRHGMNAMNILTGQPLVNRKISLVRPYAFALATSGPGAAMKMLEKLQLDTLTYVLNEDDMNELGLQLLYAATYKDHVVHALIILKQNTIWFPEAFNTFDSYGEALAFTGNKTEAITMYRKSLELNPNNKGGKEALEKLMQ